MCGCSSHTEVKAEFTHPDGKNWLKVHYTPFIAENSARFQLKWDASYSGEYLIGQENRNREAEVQNDVIKLADPFGQN